jgi:hypothetical protein
MSLDQFLRHLSDTRPRFECEPAGPPQDHRIEVEISHRLLQPATSSATIELRRLLSRPNPEVEALYRVHDGMDLYIQGSTVGLALYPIARRLYEDNSTSSRTIFSSIYGIQK